MEGPVGPIDIDIFMEAQRHGRWGGTLSFRLDFSLWFTLRFQGNQSKPAHQIKLHLLSLLRTLLLTAYLIKVSSCSWPL